MIDLLALMLLPAFILVIIGLALLSNKHKKAGKVFIILGILYVIISLGICGTMLANFSLN